MRRFLSGVTRGLCVKRAKTESAWGKVGKQTSLLRAGLTLLGGGCGEITPFISILTYLSLRPQPSTQPADALHGSSKMVVAL